MDIEIITTGNEILIGRVVDSNKSWVAERCQMLGHKVIRHTSVGDDEQAIGDALQAACKRADCVIVSGGLGPTSDDITVEAAAKSFGVTLYRDDDVVESIQDFFHRRDREMSDSNLKQAQIPEGGEVLPNKVGTAPGIRVKLGDAWTIFLPGVPKELYQIFNDSVMPWLAGESSQRFVQKILRCFGQPEADIAQQLDDLEFGKVQLAYQVKFPDILLRLVAYDADEKKAKSLLDDAARRIYERIGALVYAEGEDVMQDVVGSMLRDAGVNLACAESCTGGLLASMFTDAAGASEYFECGFVTYSNASKMQLLGISEETLRANGAVSRETAMAMAEGARRAAGTNLGVALTGIAGPGGSTPDKPVGTVYIALATPDGTDCHHYVFARDRIWFKKMAATAALNMIRRYLLTTKES